jgi:hypothetical protein
MMLANPATTLSGPGTAAVSRRIVASSTTGHEDAVGSGFEVSDRPLDGLGVRVAGAAAEVGVGAGVQPEGGAGRLGPGGCEAVDSLIDAEQPVRPGIFGVAAHRSEAHRPGHGEADVGRGVAPAGFEVCGHGDAHRSDDATDVLEHRVTVQDFSVRDSAGPSNARAGRGDGREADLLENASGPGIPGVREHEARTGVQGEEDGGLVGGRSTGHERGSRRCRVRRPRVVVFQLAGAHHLIVGNRDLSRHPGSSSLSRSYVTFPASSVIGSQTASDRGAPLSAPDG